MKITAFLFLSRKTLAGSRSVVSDAHFQTFTYFTAPELSRPRSVTRRARVSWCWNSQDHGRLPDKHISKHSPSYHAESLKITVSCPSCIEPIPARLRQLRVVIQEIEQDDVQVVTPRPEPHMSTRPKQKRKVGRKGRLNIASNQKSVNAKNKSQVIIFPLRL